MSENTRTPPPQWSENVALRKENVTLRSRIAELEQKANDAIDRHAALVDIRARELQNFESRLAELERHNALLAEVARAAKEDQDHETLSTRRALRAALAKVKEVTE